MSISDGTRSTKKQWVICIVCILLFSATILYWNAVDGYLWKRYISDDLTDEHMHSTPQQFADNPSLTSELDVIKYKSTNTSICDVWERSAILVGSHHKTGSRLLGFAISEKILQRYIRHKCLRKNPSLLNYSLYEENKHKRGRFAILMGMRGSAVHKFYDKSIETLNKTQNNAYSYHFVTLNIIRDPVDTVLSEYNFDKKCKEHPAVDPIGIIKIKHIKHTMEKYYLPIIEPILNLTKDEIMANYSLQMLWNNHLSIEYGLIGAWILYKYWYYPEVVVSYETIKHYADLQRDNPYLHYGNFKLDSDFGTNFSKSCEKYLDKVGILNPYHRSQLMKLFMEQDISKRKRTHHVTKGSYNKTLQLELLLKSPQRCIELKEMSAKLDYKWRFAQKC